MTRASFTTSPTCLTPSNYESPAQQALFKINYR
jgi:hypothetical protein